MQVKNPHPCLPAGVCAPLTEQVSPVLQTLYELVNTLQVSGGYVSLYFPEILWEDAAASANQIEPLSWLPAKLRGNISEYYKYRRGE